MSVLKLITIDGPSASGKSSVSRMVAQKLGWKWVSTGAFYRGLALASIKLDVATTDEPQLLQLAQSHEWYVQMAPVDTQVYFQSQDVTHEISGEEVGAVASQISQIPAIRQALLERQRQCFVEDQGLVAEGRDCGTVVFPQAPVKIYLTANPALRARRRSEEEGADESLTQELQIQRDAQDRQRKVAPLKEADGALRIDSSFLSLVEVVSEVLKYAKSKGVNL